METVFQIFLLAVGFTMLIKEAKELLMFRNNMTEEEAYRYIQKCSMDSGTNMVETAQMVLTMFT